MNYYYLDGIEKRGPYSLSEIHSRNLSSDTMVFKEGSNKWVRLSDIEDIKSKKIVDSYTGKKVKKNNLYWIRKNKKILFASITAFLVVGFSFFIINQFTLTEKQARETANRFFNMLVINNLDENILKEVYPDFNSMGNRLVFKKPCKITSISKNSDGNYEVFATYQPNKVNSYPMYLLVAKEGGDIIIKSSKGLNYAYYDRVLEYGKKKGCLTGNEDDVEMGKIIKDKDLRYELDFKTQLMISTLYDNLKKNDNLRYNYGYISGDVTITNNNDVDFGYFDFECTVVFYGRNGQITSSEKVYSINSIMAHSSSTGRIFNSSDNAVKYKIICTIKETYELKNKVKDRIVLNTLYGCD
ncbi:DUF4339 domain-containing protein [Flavobacterium sp.]|jgi:hypothetical protein|uniref:DUF4339 domain-containing protein n=1 Tax=Flavobacterium sp. TaxID=239 RepID=UPI0037C0D541